MKCKVALLLVWFALSLGLSGCEMIWAIIQNRQPDPVPVTTPTEPEAPTPTQPDSPPAPTGRAAVLAGLPEGSQMNIRAQPSMQAPVIYYGTVGDRVHVTKQQQDSNQAWWYYVTFDHANAQGWVYGNLIRFLDSPASPDPSPNPAPITSDTALRRCRSQAEAEFPNARIQVSLGSLNSDGSYTVKWSASSGAYGTCTVDRNGWVTSFINTYQEDRPPEYSIPAVALRGCENRVARQLGLSLYRVEVRESAAYRDGTFGVDWWTTTGRSGFCRVNRRGNVLAFVINDTTPPRQIALNRCRDRARKAYPASRIQVYIDPLERGKGYKVIWSANTGEDGYCRVDGNGRVYEFVDYSKGGGDGSVRCFGNIFSDTAFTAFARDRQFRRVEFRNTRTGYHSTANLNAAGENQQGQLIYRGRVAGTASDEVTVIDRSGGRPNPGTEISLGYNREWARGRCR